MTKEIAYWNYRASQLRELEQSGHANARLNADKARARADDLHMRLQNRMSELAQQRQIVAQPPIVVGGVLVVSSGLMARMRGERVDDPAAFSREARRIASLALNSVQVAEKSLGFEPRDVSSQRLGYGIESRDPVSGRLRFIDVKGWMSGAKTVPIAMNEIITALNKPDDYILALVAVPPRGEHGNGNEISTMENDLDASSGCEVRYVRRPFKREPDFGKSSVSYELPDLLATATAPQ